MPPVALKGAGLRSQSAGVVRGRRSGAKAAAERVGDPRHRLGREAEDAAAEFLRRRGFEIIGRNVRTARGEIDLVARDGGTWVFVEVKARRGTGAAGGLEAVDARKQRRLSRLALDFMARAGLTEAPARFDVVAVDGRSLACTHVVNAFDCALNY